MEPIGDILRRLEVPKAPRAENKSAEPEAEACPLCDGAGFVRVEVPLGHPDFGKAFPCRCTLKTMERNREARLERYADLGALRRLTFDNLIPQGRSPDKANQERFARAYKAARAFAENPTGWLVLTGPSGCGKTHLAAAIANHCIKQGQPAYFRVVPDLLDHLRSTYSPQSELTYDELFEKVKEAPLLILDDLGTQSSTPWAQEKLFQLINHRYVAQLPTVFTTNLSLEELGERLRTRLGDPHLSQVILVESRPLATTEGLEGFGLLRSMTFDNFDPKRTGLSTEQRYSLDVAYRQARSFAEAPDGWLVLFGPRGCGKTHLAAAVANHWQSKGHRPEFIVVPDFLDRLRATSSPDSEVRYDEYFERVKRAPFLVLDDLGEQFSTPWAREKLYQLINFRYNAKLPTVITTSNLEDLEERIRSRLQDLKVSFLCKLDVPSYRGDELPPPPRRPRPSFRPGRLSRE